MSLLSFAASLLTGACVEDVTLASRTGCLSLAALRWDEDFLSELDLCSRNFPTLIEQGGIAGSLKESFCGVPKGTPVALAGHDHICAAAATDDLKYGGLFLLCGTAQVLLKATLSFESESGLSYGPGFGGGFIALGSIQSAGGSINLFKRLLYPGQDYSVMLEEAAHSKYLPVLTYYPYLAGSGAPHADPLARAALTGLGNDTERGDILCSVYAGIALETRFLAKSLSYDSAFPITCMGGLTRHTRYMQILSDVLGARVNVPGESEGTLYGAARLSGKVNEIVSLPPLQTGKQYTPSADYVAQWDKAYGDYLDGMRRLYDKES